MLILETLTAVLFALLVLSYIWARFYFFTVSSEKSRLFGYFYDPIIATHILFTVHGFYCSDIDTNGTVPFVVGAAFYSISLIFFWWSITKVGSLEFAMGTNVGNIITAGPFKIIRHPFYSSYMLTWITGTFIFDSIPLWITLLAAVTFYISSALEEEKQIIKSEQGQLYKEYKKRVGMFFPKATQWKNWFSRLYPRQTK